MRIGMLADVYKPHISGVTNCVALNKRALEALGHKVFVFTFGNEDYEDDELYVVRSPALLLRETGYYLGFRYASRAQRKVESMDVVHVHHPFISGPLALRHCRRRGIPVVFTSHTRYDLYSQYYLPMVPEALSRAFLETYLPRFCAQCDLTIAPSTGLARVLRELGVTTPIEVVPNGVDLAPFQGPVARRTRRELGLGEDDTVLIYVGRLGPEKNLTFLIRAFAGALAAVGQSTLLLVGDGPEADNLRDQAAHYGIASQVRMTGPVPYEDVPGYMCLADAFVTASVTEVHPLSLIEGMAAGLPVVGIQSPGTEDTIVDGVNGILTSDSLADFTAGLVRLMRDAPLRHQLAAGARNTSQAYSIERTSSLMLEHYQRLVAEIPRPRPPTGKSRASR
jgi:glycosyltransferase involved in cell wall biosynthesis